MKLIAMNETSAVFVADEKRGLTASAVIVKKPDIHALLKALVAVKNWKTMIKFLDLFASFNMACDDEFTLVDEEDYSYKESLFDFIQLKYIDSLGASCSLPGSCGDAAFQRDLIYLTPSFLTENLGARVFFLELGQVDRLRKFLDGLLRYGAIGNGCKDAFGFVDLQEIKVSSLFGGEPEGFYYSFVPSFEREFCGGYVDDFEQFDDVTLFDVPSNFDIDSYFGYEEKPVLLYKERKLSISKIKQEICGRFACGVLNARPALIPRTDLEYWPETYSYSIRDGIFLNPEPEFDSDYDLDISLGEYAFQAIVNHHVSLCPNCGKPVITSKSHGVEAAYCSRSCITTANKQRRDTAIKYAASGKSVQIAIKKIGEEYADSVRRWYVETLGTNPAR